MPALAFEAYPYQAADDTAPARCAIELAAKGYACIGPPTVAEYYTMPNWMPEGGELGLRCECRGVSSTPYCSTVASCSYKEGYTTNVSCVDGAPIDPATDPCRTNADFACAAVLTSPYPTFPYAYQDTACIEGEIACTCNTGLAPCSCSDGLANGAETGVDCGGPLCPPCPSSDCTNSRALRTSSC